MKDYLYENALFGRGVIYGFGEDDFYVAEIPRNLAYKIIEENHYAKKGDSIPHNKLNLGLYINKKLVGVLQFGYAMNVSSYLKLVTHTELDEYLELNRMWLDDSAPRNSESKALSYSIKFIKKKMPKIKWIQSFADERCGGFGIVYQAANFNYYGEHKSIFWEIDNEIYHNSIVTNSKRKAKYKLQYKLKDAKKLTVRQFRYIYFIKKSYKKKCLLTECKYPKHYI